MVMFCVAGENIEQAVFRKGAAMTEARILIISLLRSILARWVGRVNYGEHFATRSWNAKCRLA